MTRRGVTFALGCLLLLISAACGNTSSTTASSSQVVGPGSSSAVPSQNSSGAHGDPRDPSGNYACGLLSAAQIAAVAGGPAQPPKGQSPTIDSLQVINTCTFDSVATCPDMPRDNPFCPSAFHIDVTTSTWTTASGAMSAFTSLKQQTGANANPGNITGADDSFVVTTAGSGEAIKGTTIVTVDLQPPGSLSGNPAVAATFVPSAVAGAQTLLQNAVTSLGG